MDDSDLEVQELWGPDHDSLLYAAAACAEGHPEVDSAILRHAARRGLHAREIEKQRPRVRATPPTADRRRTSVLRGDGVLYVKGEVEGILSLCPSGLGEAPEVAAKMAARGLRVVATATGASEREANLTLWGLIGLSRRSPR
jgi:hypothetical protein